MKKQYIIPIFVPHLGCPNNCTFCNQKSISGQLKEITPEEVKEKIAHQKEKYSWEFLFLGADIDAFGAARSLGISADRTARYSNNAYGIERSCLAMSEFISAKRMNLSAENWRACLEPEPPEQADGQPEKRQNRARLPKRGGNDEKQ